MCVDSTRCTGWRVSSTACHVTEPLAHCDVSDISANRLHANTMGGERKRHPIAATQMTLMTHMTQTTLMTDTQAHRHTDDTRDTNDQISRRQERKDGQAHELQHGQGHGARRNQALAPHTAHSHAHSLSVAPLSIIAIDRRRHVPRMTSRPKDDVTSQG